MTQVETAPDRPGLSTFLIRGVLLKGLPLALLFSVFTLFPFSVNNPLERVGNIPGYLVVWTIIGLILGYGTWRRGL